MSGEAIRAGSTWRRNPPGREVVQIERVWMYSALGEPAEVTVRAHPVTGGRPLVAPLTYLYEHYTQVTAAPQSTPTTESEGS